MSASKPIARAAGLPDILPTHTCFDDAIDFLLDFAHDANNRSFCVVHGLCVGRSCGTLYVHAWVEEANRQLVWQGGVIRATAKHVWWALPRAEFYRLYAVQKTSRYPVERVMAMLDATNFNGPWRPDYLALQNTVRDRVVGTMQGLPPVHITERHVTLNADPR